MNFTPLLDSWQDIVDLLAEILNVPAGLIMFLNKNEELEVCRSSNNTGNPYVVGEKEKMANSGLYCETVIRTDHILKVPDALADPDWENNPDLKLDMVAYLGLPLHWPDGRPFGTICVLDNKKNRFSQVYENLLEKFRNTIENELLLLEKNEKLKRLSELDPLTGILNRRSFFNKSKVEFYRAVRYGTPLSILILDVDDFKRINDTYGHLAGDRVITAIAELIEREKRPTDIAGRYGGEEFILTLPHTVYKKAFETAERLLNKCADLKIDLDDGSIELTISIGVASYQNDEKIESLVKRADEAMYRAKRGGKNSIR